jgi:hypothetical protein
LVIGITNEVGQQALDHNTLRETVFTGCFGEEDLGHTTNGNPADKLEAPKR